ncbi:uncharacterized protein LOC111343882 [Stylophora pistillata]|uniref:uncharacterized protein LOC111343882 n=1 Tax=Stylophora pistillata TaxID=50429 RepID=UPI000C03A32B|nr:uncharacterized protein LOC111343882 [Stylophora pistillata]
MISAVDQRGLLAHDIIKHRIRKALKAIPESYGNWTGIVVKFAVENVRPLGKRLYPSICTQHPKNQTFLQVNLSSYEYHFPDAILLKILAFPYSPKEELTDALQFKPPVPTSPTLAEGSLPTASTKPPKFSCTRDKYGDYEWHPRTINGSFIQRDDGEWFVNISWTPFKISSVNWTSYYIEMLINPNATQLIHPLQCFKLPKNQTYFIVDYAFHGWKYPERIEVAVTAYPFPETVNGYYMVHITQKQEPPILTAASSPTSRTRKVEITVFSSVGSAFVLGLLAFALYRFFRKPSSPATRNAIRRAFQNHAFIIYSTTESEWVNNVLLATLQSYGFNCCIHWKDFQPGTVFHQSIVDSVYNSYKIIAVVSESFFRKENCKFEVNHAINRLMNEGDDCLIIIKYDDVDLDVHLPSLLNRSYIDLPNPTDRSTWESRLVSVLREAVIEEEASGHNEGNAKNNNESNGNSSNDDDSLELTCSCQSCGLMTTNETHSACRS